ncbi:hypothetical protein [Parasynechococcus sp.]|uniref:hypothetical protein n=1 Tax=Parasynechococcus sp. TaxID=3101203 RepID=UPI003703B3E2
MPVFRRCHGLFLVLVGGVIAVAPVVQAMTFSLRSTAVLSRQPTFKSSDRLELDPLKLLVVGPALEQSDGFCRYELRNRSGQPISTETAWTPCYNIDRLMLP